MTGPLPLMNRVIISGSVLVDLITIGSIIIANAKLPDNAENVPKGFTIQK